MVLNHVGIIMDGNRRYARKNLLDPLKGHEEGSKRVKEIIDVSINNNISEISLYVFSSRNFNRPKEEINYLFDLFIKKFEELKKEDNKDVRVNFAGKKELFPKKIQVLMKELEENTKNNDRIRVNFCMGYDGQEEIIESAKRCNEQDIEITDENIQKNLWVKNPVDLIIRTSGENRLSGFLLWHSSYAEFYFSKKLWPEFNRIEYQKAIDEYKERHRRFGK